MKRLLNLKFTALLLLATIGSQVVHPQKAEAYMIVSILTGAEDIALDLNQDGKILCAIFAPICFPLLVLGEDQASNQGVPDIDPAWLAANGYSPVEQQRALSDFTKIKSRGLALQLDNHDSKKTIAEGLRKIEPSISPVTIDVVVNFLGVSQ